MWELSDRCDPAVRPLADRHYNRQSIGALNFVPPGRCLVLRAIAPDGTTGAFWVTSWPFAEYVRHAWPGAWVCSAFRNERPDVWLSSDMVRAALAATRREWTPPDLGMITFVNHEKVRAKRDPGRCFLKAGFRRVGTTEGGLVALQILPDEMPPPNAAKGTTGRLFD